MQRYTIFFIIVNALHVSGGFSTHHQDLKNYNTASGICQAVIIQYNKLLGYKIWCVKIIVIWGLVFKQFEHL